MIEKIKNSIWFNILMLGLVIYGIKWSAREDRWYPEAFGRRAQEIEHLAQ